MVYGYIRVSTAHQNIDRQYNEIKKLGISDNHIHIDKESGKDFERTEYKKLLRKIKANDLIVIKSIDRLGRNYKMILEEWAYITKTLCANIKVLDMPLLDTTLEQENLIGHFVSDIVLQILSFVAENERINIRERQKEGIRLAKERGIVFGRPKIKLPENHKNIIRQYLANKITACQCAKTLGISRSTFYNLLRCRD